MSVHRPEIAIARHEGQRGSCGKCYQQQPNCRCHSDGEARLHQHPKQEHGEAGRAPPQRPMAGSGDRRSPYFGNEMQRYSWGQHHSAGTQPYQLAPEPPLGNTLTPEPHFGHESQCYSWDNRCHCASTQPYQLPPEGYSSSQFPPEPPLTQRMSHEQIMDHYSSLRRDAPRQTVPSMQPFAGTRGASDTNYNDSRSPWPSSGGAGGGWPGGGRGPVPTATHPPEQRQARDLPPSYESLFPSGPDGER